MEPVAVAVADIEIGGIVHLKEGVAQRVPDELYRRVRRAHWCPPKLNFRFINLKES